MGGSGVEESEWWVTSRGHAGWGRAADENKALGFGRKYGQGQGGPGYIGGAVALGALCDVDDSGTVAGVASPVDVAAESGRTQAPFAMQPMDVYLKSGITIYRGSLKTAGVGRVGGRRSAQSVGTNCENDQADVHDVTTNMVTVSYD
ncbi:hypothetical protein CVT25_006888 [Psilocybe cyanescens]|uniref:Uncharacterized protein n=1 Tax=Psilocybe cyanescens TaxID=93625 RepID=A0A409X619_PSICY|nr:hypothetical protein CVT25_006888 [Psilocybe cyanescens]